MEQNEFNISFDDQSDIRYNQINLDSTLLNELENTKLSKIQNKRVELDIENQTVCSPFFQRAQDDISTINKSQKYNFIFNKKSKFPSNQSIDIQLDQIQDILDRIDDQQDFDINLLEYI